jgi:hypothetical protein
MRIRFKQYETSKGLYSKEVLTSAYNEIILKKETNFIFLSGHTKSRPSLEFKDEIDTKIISLFFKFIITGREDRDRNIAKIRNLCSRRSFLFF